MIVQQEHPNAHRSPRRRYAPRVSRAPIPNRGRAAHTVGTKGPDNPTRHASTMEENVGASVAAKRAEAMEVKNWFKTVPTLVIIGVVLFLVLSVGSALLFW